MKKKKFSSFGDFILNDKEIVMPFLITTSIVFSIIIFSLMVFLSFYYDFDMFFKVLFCLMLGASFWRLYKHIKFGGWRTLKGLTANDIVWNGKVGK